MTTATFAIVILSASLSELMLNVNQCVCAVDPGGVDKRIKIKHGFFCSFRPKMWLFNVHFLFAFAGCDLLYCQLTFVFGCLSVWLLVCLAACLFGCLRSVS